MPLTILITGCTAGGIGSALALAAAEHGHTVLATLRTTSKADQAVAEHRNITLLSLDVTDATSLEAAAAKVAEATEDHGGLDVLVNNAGAGYNMPILDLDLDKARGLFEVNVWGSLAATKAFFPSLERRQGLVVNVCSIQSHINAPWIGTYAASKAAMVSYSETLRLELQPLGVSVMTLQVGAIKTGFFDNLPPVRLPEHSRYMAISDKIAKMNEMDDPEKRAEPKDFAAQVLVDIERRRVGKVYRGPFAGTFKWLACILPDWVVDRQLLGELGLSGLDLRNTKKL